LPHALAGSLSRAVQAIPLASRCAIVSNASGEQGSTYGIAAFFQRENVTVAGARKAYIRASDSGYPVTFYFCPHCGSTVYWKPDRKPEMVAVAVGAFADPTFPAPSQALYSEHRHRWVPSAPAS
jgi:hypothetical protein